MSVCGYNLYLTLPEGSTVDRATRGSIRKGLAQLYQGRMKTLMYSSVKIPFAVAPPGGTMHAVFGDSFPQDLKFPVALGREDLGKEVMVTIMREALKCVLRKNPVNDDTEQILQQHVTQRTPAEVEEYKTVVRLFQKRPKKAPSAKRVPKPLASWVNCLKLRPSYD